jgi:5-methylthioribose kinase
MTSTSNFTPISGSNGLDLSSERDVLTYLENTPYNSTDVIPLSGGTVNYVFRLKLVAPYLGRETLVLKHAKPYVKDCHMIQLGLDRQVSGASGETLRLSRVMSDANSGLVRLVFIDEKKTVLDLYFPMVLIR